jgi:hypothetical protein
VGTEAIEEIAPLSEPRKVKRLSEVWPTMNRNGPIGLPVWSVVSLPHPTMMKRTMRMPEINVAFIASPDPE